MFLVSDGSGWLFSSFKPDQASTSQAQASPSFLQFSKIKTKPETLKLKPKSSFFASIKAVEKTTKLPMFSTQNLTVWKHFCATRNYSEFLKIKLDFRKKFLLSLTWKVCIFYQLRLEKACQALTSSSSELKLFGIFNLQARASSSLWILAFFRAFSSSSLAWTHHYSQLFLWYFLWKTQKYFH